MTRKSQPYTNTLQDLLREFSKVVEVRDTLTVKLVELVAAIRAISRLTEGTPTQEYVNALEDRIWQPRPPLSTGIRFVLQTAPEPLTPVQIKNALIGRGYDLRKYSFAMAAIHTSLKALVAQGLVIREVHKDDSKTYKWRDQVPRAGPPA